MVPQIKPPTPTSGARKTQPRRPLPGPLSDLGAPPGDCLMYTIDCLIRAIDCLICAIDCRIRAIDCPLADLGAPLGDTASERRGDNLKCFKGFSLKANAGIWPRLSYMSYMCLQVMSPPKPCARIPGSDSVKSGSSFASQKLISQYKFVNLYLRILVYSVIYDSG